LRILTFSVLFRGFRTCREKSGGKQGNEDKEQRSLNEITNAVREERWLERSPRNKVVGGKQNKRAIMPRSKEKKKERYGRRRTGQTKRETKKNTNHKEKTNVHFRR
jgi:hypothetical protein